MGFIVSGIGAIIFILPHFVSDPYDPYIGADMVPLLGGKVPASTTVRDANFCEKLTKAKFMACIIIGHILVGLGSIANKILAPTYFDENVKESTVPVYHSLWFMSGMAGVIAGILGGGFALDQHTDFHRTIKTHPEFKPVVEFPNPIQLPTLSPTLTAKNISMELVEIPNSLFVGNWWLGILIAGCVLR